MEIIKDINKLMDKINYKYKVQYSDEQLNKYYNYWYFLDISEDEIIRLTNISIEQILYSKYYWSTYCINEINRLYGEDVSLKQQQYKILEDMDIRLDNVDWEFVQQIDSSVKRLL